MDTQVIFEEAVGKNGSSHSNREARSDTACAVSWLSLRNDPVGTVYQLYSRGNECTIVEESLVIVYRDRTGCACKLATYETAESVVKNKTVELIWFEFNQDNVYDLELKIRGRDYQELFEYEANIIG